MHRFAQRLFGAQPPATTYRTDGSGMGKLLVADRMGVTVLPDYSVVDDPLSRAGLLVHRPLAGDSTEITLALVQRRAQRMPESVRELRQALVRRGQAYREQVPAGQVPDRFGASRWEVRVPVRKAPACNHLSWLEAAVVGLLQGVTELFPISSLGHSVLLPAVLGGSWARDLDVAAPESPYLAFIVGTHVATALALLVFYRRDWAPAGHGPALQPPAPPRSPRPTSG